ncbi:MAG: VanZ family protein [Flavobacteriaceae bacterium]|nr:VanZ family protein [Flavobacteriaceae bacterium]
MGRSTIWLVLLLLWNVLIFAVCTMPIDSSHLPSGIPHLDKIAHFGLFFVLSVLFYAYLCQQKRVPQFFKFLIIIVFIGAYGWLIEWLQGTYFNRSKEFWDWVADILGGITGVLLGETLRTLFNCIKRLFLKYFR